MKCIHGIKINNTLYLLISVAFYTAFQVMNDLISVSELIRLFFAMHRHVLMRRSLTFFMTWMTFAIDIMFGHWLSKASASFSKNVINACNEVNGCWKRYRKCMIEAQILVAVKCIAAIYLNSFAMCSVTAIDYSLTTTIDKHFGYWYTKQ